MFLIALKESIMFVYFILSFAFLILIIIEEDKYQKVFAFILFVLSALTEYILCCCC